MRIQHNIMAMNSYRNYTNNVSAMKKNLEKLSSGYKINRAGDDAAGLAISEKMRAQITGLETAQKNAKDGISLVQTAEGALTEVHDMLNRMVELASQSANGTYDNTTDRAQMQKEIDQLLSEINRIADSANFNGIKLLDGSMAGGAIEAAKYDATGMLPAVGKVLGTDTVLHSEAGQSADETTFSMDFHNTKISGAKGTEFTLKVGDVTLTGTLAKDFGEGAELTGSDIVAALKDSTETSKVSFKIGTAAYDSTNFTVNGAKFEADTASTGTRVSFKSDESVDPDMKVSIALSDKDAPTPVDAFTISTTPAGKSGGFTAGTAKPGEAVTVGGDTDAADWTSTTDADMSGLDGKAISVTVGGKTFTATFVANGTADIGDDQVELGAANEDPAELIGKIKANLDAQIAAYNTEAAKGKADYTKIETLAWTAGNKTITGATATLTPQTYDATAGTDTSSKVDIDFSTKTGADVMGQSIKIGDKTYQFVKDAADVAQGNTAVVITDAEADIATKLKTEVAKDTEFLKKVKGGNATGMTVANNKLTIEAKDKDTDITGEVAKASNTPDTPKLSGDYNVSTTVLQKKADGAGERLASTYFDLTKEMAGNGSSVTIGKTAYTFTTDAADKALITANTDNKVYVGDLDLTTKEGLTTAAERLTNVAKGNATYTVGHDGKRMTFTENAGQTDFAKNGKSTLDTLENIEKSFGFKVAAQEADATKGLTLQIGDTADSFNQLKVNIKDMHAASLGLDKIKISDQASAAKAVDVIKDAINTVSDVRGTLGATQNRLDHTINNLSVMTENIQDAESTIRDVDVAEEMMAYTKNNILIQSAQAMLAQANQVPQGVLQLLQ